MKRTVKGTGQKVNVVRNVGKSIGAFLVVMLLGVMLQTTFVLSGLIEESGLMWFTVALLILAGTVGGFLTCRQEGNKCVLRMGVYILGVVMVLLLTNIIFLGGEFSNVLWKVTAIAVGCAISLMVKRGGRKKKRVLYKTHNR